jgi:hypothetical protein
MENVRMYTKGELENEIQKRGMRIKNLYGSSEGETFDAEYSKIIILIDQR